MKKGIASKKIAAYAIICGSLFVWRPAHAFIWPVIDLTEVTSFAQTIANGIGQVSNATSQLQEINKTITMVGEQVASSLSGFRVEVRMWCVYLIDVGIRQYIIIF